MVVSLLTHICGTWPQWVNIGHMAIYSALKNHSHRSLRITLSICFPETYMFTILPCQDPIFITATTLRVTQYGGNSIFKLLPAFEILSTSEMIKTCKVVTKVFFYKVLTHLNVFRSGRYFRCVNWRKNIHCCCPECIYNMITSSNGKIFRVTGHLREEFTGPRWIPRTKASDAELWFFLWSASE